MMPHGHDKHAIDIKFVTLAGNEYSMQANLTHYDDLTQLEDDIISFLPTVSDIEVFGCEVNLLEPDTQLYLCQRTSIPRCCSKINCRSLYGHV